VLTVTCFLWDGEVPGGSPYEAEHVRVLASMCRRHLPKHRFVCYADRDVPGVETIPLDPEVLQWGKRYPKLLVWRREALRELGPRILLLDLDCVILRDLAPLADRDEDVVLWRDPGLGLYNTSMVLLWTATRHRVWQKFTGPKDARLAKRGPGTDQEWVRHCLGDGEPTWGAEDGVLSYKYDLKRGMLKPPEHTRIVFFHGKPKPWQVEERWVREHWR
jgi:hypothetical protein